MLSIVSVLAMLHLGELHLGLHEQLHPLDLKISDEFHALLLQKHELLELRTLDPLVDLTELQNGSRELLEGATVVDVVNVVVIVADIVQELLLLKRIALPVAGHVEAIGVAIGRVGGLVGFGRGRVRGHSHV